MAGCRDKAYGCGLSVAMLVLQQLMLLSVSKHRCIIPWMLV